MPGKRNSVTYECCPEPYVDITFTIHIRFIFYYKRLISWSVLLPLLLTVLFVVGAVVTATTTTTIIVCVDDTTVVVVVVLVIVLLTLF